MFNWNLATPNQITTDFYHLNCGLDFTFFIYLLGNSKYDINEVFIHSTHIQVSSCTDGDWCNTWQ